MLTVYDVPLEMEQLLPTLQILESTTQEEFDADTWQTVR